MKLRVSKRTLTPQKYLTEKTAVGQARAFTTDAIYVLRVLEEVAIFTDIREQMRFVCAGYAALSMWTVRNPPIYGRVS